MFRVLGGCSIYAERALRLAGAAAALRQNIGVPLTPAEQVKLEASLDACTAGIEQRGRRDGVVGRLGFASGKSYRGSSPTGGSLPFA